MNKKLLNAIIFLSIAVLTFYALFHGQNLPQIADAVKKIPVQYLLLAMASALFFVSMEGVMIWYLLRAVNGRSGLLRCISYSFIGFFYSGITPSASGGQPMQLYYMKKDGNTLSGSTVVLMTVAIIYKFVLVVLGLGILILWYGPMQEHLQGYFGLYILGLSLNVVLVAVLLAVMLAPDIMRRLIRRVAGWLTKLHILKASEDRLDKIDSFIGGYREAVQFLKHQKQKVVMVIFGTFLQRMSVFVMTYIIYRGFSLHESKFWPVVILQASVYIAVDMLPIPGAQGITELMYTAIFLPIFTDKFLMPSLCVTRGINFYLLLLVSLLVVVVNYWTRKKRIPEAV